MSRSSDLIFLGVKGTVVALDRATGAERWRTKLRGGDFVNVVVDGGDVLASTKGEIHCLDAASGGVRWVNKLNGLGYGMVAIGSASGQQAVTAAEKRRQEAAAAAAAGAAAAS
jgi:outer membrane protein assembly factor BamB